MSNIQLIRIRKQWFKLKAREFIRRYAAGLMVLFVFLPGVAIGDNFKMLLIAATKPLLIVVLNRGSLVYNFTWLFVISLIFIVWARAQRHAITGGAFAKFMRSLPINETLVRQNNIIMLIISNHFLWFFLIIGVYILNQSPDTVVIDNIRYLFLVFLLICFQLIAVFKPKKQYFVILSIFSVVFSLPVAPSVQWLIMPVLFTVLVLFMNQFFLIKEQIFSTQDRSLGRKHSTKLTHMLSQNLYMQMLFKSGLTSTLFRLLIVTGLIIALSFLAEHFASLNNNDLLPYAYVLEAILAYYLSGFYVVFADERKPMQSVFDSLPLKKTFWFWRDLFTVFLITLTIHIFYYAWLQDKLAITTLSTMLLFHMLLLLVCYPLRTLVKNFQTFISFVVLFIITAITLFNVLP